MRVPFRSLRPHRSVFQAGGLGRAGNDFCAKRRRPRKSPADGRPFLVMEPLEGESMPARLVRGPMPLAEALHVTLGVLVGKHCFELSKAT
jgi:hypothetical protein